MKETLFRIMACSLIIQEQMMDEKWDTLEHFL